MLLYSRWERHIVFLLPSTERVQEKDGVLVAQLEELLSGVLEEEHVSVVEGISHLESVEGVASSLLGDVVDLSRGHSVLIVSIIELNLSGEGHALSGDQEVALFHDIFDFVVLLGEGSKSSSGNFFLSVSEEDGFFDDGEHIFGDLGALQGKSLLALELLSLLGGDVLSDGDGEQVLLGGGSVGQGVHLQDFQELHLIHELSQRICPSLADGLEVLNLLFIQIDGRKFLKSGLFLGGGGLDERLSDGVLLVVLEDSVIFQSLENQVDALVEGELAGGDVHLWVFRGFVWVRDSSEVGDDSSSGLLVESLNISLFTGVER